MGDIAKLTTLDLFGGGTLFVALVRDKRPAAKGQPGAKPMFEAPKAAAGWSARGPGDRTTVCRTVA